MRSQTLISNSSLLSQGSIRLVHKSFERTLILLPHRRIAASPHRRIAASPHRRIAASPHRRIAASPHRRIAASPHRIVFGPTTNRSHSQFQCRGPPHASALEQRQGNRFVSIVPPFPTGGIPMRLIMNIRKKVTFGVHFIDGRDSGC
jgi:hypothetical protein